MTIKNYNRNYLLRYFIYSLAGFLVALTYSIVSIMNTSNDFSIEKIVEQERQIKGEIQHKQNEIKEIREKIQQRKNARINIENEQRRLRDYAGKLNVIGINNGLFDLRLKSIQESTSYINHASAVLEIKAPTKHLSDELSAEIFADTILKDKALKANFRAYKDHFEVIGNEIYFTIHKRVNP